jgi:hypothetical protein
MDSEIADSLDPVSDAGLPLPMKWIHRMAIDARFRKPVDMGIRASEGIGKKTPHSSCRVRSNGIGAWVPARRAVMTAEATWVVGASIERILRRFARLDAPPDGEYGRASVSPIPLGRAGSADNEHGRLAGRSPKHRFALFIFADSLTAARPALHLWSDRRVIRTNPDPAKAFNATHILQHTRGKYNHVHQVASSRSLHRTCVTRHIGHASSFTIQTYVPHFGDTASLRTVR